MAIKIFLSYETYNQLVTVLIVKVNGQLDDFAKYCPANFAKVH